jgi:sugar phosphate isomerase/epimerase
MQLGFNSAILPDTSFDDVFGLAARLGYECVEVMCWPPGKATRRYAGVTHIDVTALASLKERIQETVDRTGVEISALGYYPNALSANVEESELAVDHIRQVISASAQLGLDRMNTFVGRDHTKSVDDNWPRFLQTWTPIIRHAEACGVRIGIENCPMLFTADEWPGGKNLAASPAMWQRMFNDIPSDHFGLNFDPSHLIFQHMDVDDAIRRFANKIFHVHAKDVRVDRHRLNDVGILAYPNQYHTPKLPGLGEVNWGSFFSSLHDAKYTGPVCVEVEDRAYEADLVSATAALKQSRDFLRQYVTDRRDL